MNSSKKIKKMCLSSMFASLTAIGAFILIPLQVPITFQTVSVLCSGALLGPIWGSISQIIYVLIGILGIPVFAGGTAGFSILLGPSGGYLIGFIFAPFIIGIISKIKNNIALISSLFLGTISIYIFGITWLILSLKLNIVKSITIGLIPFIPGDIIKIIISFFLIKKLTNSGILK